MKADFRTDLIFYWLHSLYRTRPDYFTKKSQETIEMSSWLLFLIKLYCDYQFEDSCLWQTSHLNYHRRIFYRNYFTHSTGLDPRASGDLMALYLACRWCRDRWDTRAFLQKKSITDRWSGRLHKTLQSWCRYSAASFARSAFSSSSLICWFIYGYRYPVIFLHTVRIALVVSKPSDDLISQWDISEIMRSNPFSAAYSTLSSKDRRYRSFPPVSWTSRQLILGALTGFRVHALSTYCH